MASVVAQWLKPYLLRFCAGRRLYKKFCKLRVVVLIWLLYGGFLGAEDFEHFLAKKHITSDEAINALDRIPHRYRLAERMRFLKKWQKYG